MSIRLYGDRPVFILEPCVCGEHWRSISVQTLIKAWKHGRRQREQGR